MSLTTHTQRQLSYASGYLELGMKKQALEALVEILEPDRQASAVLTLGLAVRIEQGEWKKAVELAAELARRQPQVAQHWIQWAYATRRAVAIEAARAILMEGLSRHPTEGMFHFNLACYAAQLGQLDDAREYLETAYGLHEGFRTLAETDEDLKPLRG